MEKIISKGGWIDAKWPTNKDSVIWDIGGYEGFWTENTLKSVEGNIFVFEPITKFYNILKQKFNNNSRVSIFNFALGNVDKEINISVSGDASSAFVKLGAFEKCMQKNINSLFPCHIDVMAINAEGAEYEIIPALVCSGNINKIDFIQIQCHTFIDGWEDKYKNIVSLLSNTHNRIFCWDVVWEVWEIKAQ